MENDGAYVVDRPAFTDALCMIYSSISVCRQKDIYQKVGGEADMKKLNETKRILLIGCIALVLAVVGSSIFSIPGFAEERLEIKRMVPRLTLSDVPRWGGIPFQDHQGLALTQQELQTAGVGAGMSLLRSSRRSPRSFISWCFRRGRYRRRFLISSINPWSPPGTWAVQQENQWTIRVRGFIFRPAYGSIRRCS